MSGLRRAAIRSTCTEHRGNPQAVHAARQPVDECATVDTKNRRTLRRQRWQGSLPPAVGGRRQGRGTAGTPAEAGRTQRVAAPDGVGHRSCLARGGGDLRSPRGVGGAALPSAVSLSPSGGVQSSRASRATRILLPRILGPAKDTHHRGSSGVLFLCPCAASKTELDRLLRTEAP
ncbi:hypothetical protein KM043_011445 [Ampulex compressa]|nr:hypothetical protein KM043_011445 [Ampulex compressa]